MKTEPPTTQIFEMEDTIPRNASPANPFNGPTEEEEYATQAHPATQSLFSSHPDISRQAEEHLTNRGSQALPSPIDDHAQSQDREAAKHLPNRESEALPSPIDLLEQLHDIPMTSITQHPIQSPQISANPNANEHNIITVFGYLVRQRDMNIAIILVSVSGLIMLVILVLLVTTILLLNHRQ